MSNQDQYFLGTVNSNVNNDWFADVVLSHGSCSYGLFTFKIDSGACVTCIPFDAYVDSMGTLLKHSLPLFGASGHKLECMGYQQIDLTYKNVTVKQDVFFVKNLKTCLLGRPAIEALSLLRRINEVDARESKMQDKYPELFSGLGCMKNVYTLKLCDNARPYSVSTSRRVPLPLLPKVKSELQKMVEQGVIEPVTMPTDWCAPLVVIPKASGQVRICGDFVELNKNIMRERYELPTVDATLAQLSGATVFSKLDANSGFYQIKIDENSAKLTTFITPFGRFFYKRLPMGISSAPEFYMRCMAQLTDSLPGTLCLMDDICVFGKDQNEHDDRLQKLMQILSSEGQKKILLNVNSL